MKSRITIEVDFDNGQPYIKVSEDSFSDDVRDKLITFFRQQLGCTSSWCRVDFKPYGNHTELSIWTIHPIRPDELENQSQIMVEQVRLNKGEQTTESLTH